MCYTVHHSIILTVYSFWITSQRRGLNSWKFVVSRFSTIHTKLYKYIFRSIILYILVYYFKLLTRFCLISYTYYNQMLWPVMVSLRFILRSFYKTIVVQRNARHFLLKTSMKNRLSIQIYLLLCKYTVHMYLNYTMDINIS